MSRRFGAATTALFAAAAAAGAWALAGPLTPTAAAQTGPTRYLATITETSGLNDQGVPGGLGRSGTIAAELHDPARPGAAPVGSVDLELTVTATAYPSHIVELATLQIPGGSVDAQGIQSEDQTTAVLGITGGTGRYQGVGGQILVGSDRHGQPVITLEPLA